MGAKYPSIFNNVIGPIMRGPSSSHTAAAVRIGLLGRRLLGEKPVGAVVTFDPNGSLATTYRGQGSAMGFAAGLLGMDITDPELIDAEELCRKQQINLVFRIDEIGAVHPNTYQVELTGENNTTLGFTALSTGGGIIRLTKLDGGEIIDDREFVTPLMPVQVVTDPAIPFAGVGECMTLLAEHGGPLSTRAMEWESALGGLDGNAVVEIAGKHLEVMKNAVITGLAGTDYRDRILPQQSQLVKAASEEGKLIPAQLTNTIIESVTAVMETKSSMGLIVAAPTAGSAPCSPPWRKV